MLQRNISNVAASQRNCSKLVSTQDTAPWLPGRHAKRVLPCYQFGTFQHSNRKVWLIEISHSFGWIKLDTYSKAKQSCRAPRSLTAKCQSRFWSACSWGRGDKAFAICSCCSFWCLQVKWNFFSQFKKFQLLVLVLSGRRTLTVFLTVPIVWNFYTTIVTCINYQKTSLVQGLIACGQKKTPPHPQLQWGSSWVRCES